MRTLALLALALAAATPMQPPDCNQNAHYALTRAVSDGVPWIDRYAAETCDTAEADGHVYAAKAPLTAMIALPWHALLESLGAVPANHALDEGWPAGMDAAPRSGIWQFGLVAAVLPFFVLLLLLRAAADRIAPGTGATVAVAIGAGTLLLPFATVPFAHVLAAALGFGAFVSLSAGRSPLLAGVLSGLAIGADLPLGILAVALGVYVLTQLGARSAAIYSAGAGAGLVPLLAFNTWAFGDPFHLAYASSQSNQAGFFGLGVPDPGAAVQLLFSPKGLFTLSPLLAGCVVGLALLWRSGRRPEAALAGGTALAFWTYDAGYWVPFGGNTPGPRFLIPVIPLLALGLPLFLRRFPLAASGLALVSIGAMVVATLAEPLDSGFDTAAWLRQWRDGDLTESVATAGFGAQGYAAVAPFLVLLVAALVLARPTRFAVSRSDAVWAAAALAAWLLLLLAGLGVVTISVFAAALVLAVARRRPAAYAIAAVVAFFGVLRGIQLAGFPPFVDEALYALWTERVADDRAWGTALAGGKEPLLTWLGAGFVWLGASPLDAVKLVSLAAGAVTVVATALVATELAGRRAGLVAAFLAAIVPFFVVHDVIGIMEPLLAAATTSALYLQIRLARDPTPWLALALGLALAAALLTKRSGELALALLPLSILALPAAAPARERLRWFAHVAAAVVIAWLLGVESLRLSGDYDTFLVARERLGSFHSLGDGIHDWRHWLDVNLGPYLSALHGYLGLPALALGLLGLGVAARRERRLAVLLLAWTLAPLAAAVLIAENPYPRYVHGAVPPLLAIAAVGALSIWDARVRLAGRGRLALGALVVAAVVAPPLARDATILADPGRAEYPARDDRQYATDWPAGNAWVALAAELRRIGAADAGAACHGNCSFTVEWELREHPFGLVDPGSEAAAIAPFVIVSGETGRPTGLAELRQIWRYDRPRDGTPLLLYERGLFVGGRFVTTPDELRDALGLADREFDAWLASHPRARTWYLALVSPQ